MMTETRVKDLTAYRQPMVTSLGIIMGFLLNFLAGWAVRDDPASDIHGSADWIVVSVLGVSILLMVFVLYRMLDIRHPQEELEQIYIGTLRLYFTAIVLAFCGVGIALFF